MAAPRIGIYDENRPQALAFKTAGNNRQLINGPPLWYSVCLGTVMPYQRHGGRLYAWENMKLSHRKTTRRLLDLDRSKSSVLNRKLKGEPPSYWEAVRLRR